MRQVAVAFLREHLLDFRVAEGIDLQVGQRVVRFAVMRRALERRLIGRDGILVIAAGLVRMSLGRQRDRVGRQLLQYVVERRQRRFVVAGLHAFDREQRLELRILRGGIEQQLRLFEGVAEFLPFAKRLDVVDPDARIVGLEFQRAFQQELGVVEDAEANADVGEQAHALDVVRYLLQELAADVLRLQQLALADQVQDGEQRLRHLLQALELGADLLCLSFEAFARQYVELSAPACHPGRD